MWPRVSTAIEWLYAGQQTAEHTHHQHGATASHGPSASHPNKIVVQGDQATSSAHCAICSRQRCLTSPRRLHGLEAGMCLLLKAAA